MIVYFYQAKIVIYGMTPFDILIGSNFKETSAMFDSFKPTHVIHLAAKVGGLFANEIDQVSDFIFV